MAPKGSASKGKVDEAAVGDAEVHGWKSSKCADSHLLNLVESHLLQPWKVIHWRGSVVESFPHEGETNLLFFFLMFFGALAFLFLISFEASFITEGVQVHHLTPNSIFTSLSLSTYVKPFWGSSPTSICFSIFFHLKPHPNESKVDVVGGAGLQFRQGRKNKYIPYELSDKVIDWKSMWFYVRNISSSLPLRTPGPL